MRFVFFMGGFVGFTLAGLTGFSAGRAAALVLRDAAFGCLVGALLFRWFWSVVVKAVAETRERRRQEAAHATASNAKPAAQPAPAVPAAPARSR